MRRTHWLTGPLTLALATVGLLAAAPTARAAGAGGKPAVGECRNITAAEAAAKSNTTAPIPCSQAHNDRVIAVAKLPTGVTWDQLSDHQVIKQGVKQCTPAFRHTLGQNDTVRDRSAYDFVFFQPTPAQITAGARWLRCDLVLRHASSLSKLPNDKVPALGGLPLSNKVARCLKGTDNLTTTCSSTHRYRATGSFAVASKTFPGRKKLIAIGRNRCPSLVHSRNYLFTWKPKLVWNLVHDQVIVCFTKTTS
jgi:hypothetical protein